MKRIQWLAALMALVLVLGCGSVAWAAAPAKVVIWHTFTNEQNDVLNEIADAFNQSQDAYYVDVQSQAYSGFADTVYAAVSENVGPNIIFNYASTAADYIADGKALDLTPYIYDETTGMADIVDSMSKAVLDGEVLGFEDGGIYYLPAYTTGPVLFYNKTMFDALNLSVPTTWSELQAVAEAIYNEYGVPGFAVDSLTDLMQTFVMQSGHTYIDLATRTVGFDTDTFLQWLTWFAEQVQEGYFAITSTGDYWSDDFNAQMCGSYYGSCAHVEYMEPDGFEYAVGAMVRSMEDGVAWYPSWNRGPIAFASKDEAVNRGTYLFIRYFLQPENNMKWIEACNALSPYATTQALPAYAAFAVSDAGLTAVGANLDIAGSLPNIPGSARLRNALKEAATKAAYGTMTAADALAECVASANQAMAK